MLAPQLQKVYSFVENFIKEHQFSPSYTEIANAMGGSKGSIFKYLHALKEAGLLRLSPGKHRQIKLTSSTDYTIPLIGCIAAGMPIEALAENEIVDVVDLLASVHRTGQYALRVKGDSMVDEGIFDGDIVLCHSGSTAEEGEIVVALIDQQEATLKRIHYGKKGKITLIPANSTLKAQTYDAERVQIQGVFVGLLRLNSHIKR